MASAALPEKLGTLSIKSHKKSKLKVSTSMGSCHVNIEADQVTIALEPHPSAQPWMDVFHFQTLVDGKKWNPSKSLGEGSYGQSWEGRGKERLFSDCNKGSIANDGLSAGKHSVVLLATLPGMEQEWRTEAIDVDLSCDDAASSKKPDSSASSATPASRVAADNSTDEKSWCANVGFGRASWLLIFCSVICLGRRRATVDLI